MAVPTTRDEFKKHVLRRLGHPIVRVNVTDEQVEDRIDEAVNFYTRRHFGGSEKTYIVRQLTALEASEKKLVLDDTILGVVDVFPIGFSANPTTSNFFNAAAFQVMLSDVLGSNGGAGGGLSSYVNVRMTLNEMEFFLVGRFPFRYDERTDELWLDVAPEKLREGGYIVAEAYRINDPGDYPDVWSDTWLQRYAAALVKRQWGQNLSKVSGAMLPGQIQVNGTKMQMEGDQEVQSLEAEILTAFSPILTDIIG